MADHVLDGGSENDEKGQQVRRLCLFADTDSEGTESNCAFEATQVKDKRVLMRVDFNVPTP